MTVRNALLGILTLGPAYGLQLHYELGNRAAHRSSTNVGQIYATLDRHVAAGLVESAGVTAEGLPLYQLTPSGTDVAEIWLSGVNIVSLPAWEDLLDHVLIAASVSPQHTEQVLSQLELLARAQLGNASTGAGITNTPHALSALANQHFAEAVLALIVDVRDSGDSQIHGYTQNRPKRGRPRKTTTP